MADQPTILDRLIEAAQAVREFEHRVAAIDAAIDAEIDDPATVRFLAERRDVRTRHLAQKRQVLGNVIRSYEDQQAEAAHEADHERRQAEHDRMIASEA